MRLRDLKGLGPKSEKCLHDVGIMTPKELEALGAVKAYLQLKRESSITPSLNFLYAMVGAIENKNWISIAKSEKSRLLMELEGYRELSEVLANEGLKIEIN